MKTKKLILCFTTFISLILITILYKYYDAASMRETIFDRKISIPKQPVVDIPYLPPFCDELLDLKKGYTLIQDGKLYYEEEGGGIPIVLINGGPGGTHHLFHPYFSQLKDTA